MKLFVAPLRALPRSIHALNRRLFSSLGPKQLALKEGVTPFFGENAVDTRRIPTNAPKGRPVKKYGYCPKIILPKPSVLLPTGPVEKPTDVVEEREGEECESPFTNNNHLQYLQQCLDKNQLQKGMEYSCHMLLTDRKKLQTLPWKLLHHLSRRYEQPLSRLKLFIAKQFTMEMQSHIKNGDLDAALKMFDSDSSTKDVVSFAILLDALIEQNQVERAIIIWHEMELKHGIQSNSHIYSIILKGYQKRKMTKEALQLWHKIKHWPSLVNTRVAQSFLNAFLRSNAHKEFWLVWNEMQLLHLPRDVRMMVTAVECACLALDLPRAQELDKALNFMLPISQLVYSARRREASAAKTHIICACIALRRWADVEGYLNGLFRVSVRDKITPVQTWMVGRILEALASSESGSTETAKYVKLVWDHVMRSEMTLDDGCWTSYIYCLRKLNDAEMMDQALDQYITSLCSAHSYLQQQQPSRPLRVFNAALEAYASFGDRDKCHELITKMIQNNISPNTSTLNPLIDVHLQHNDIQTCLNILESNTITPGIVTLHRFVSYYMSKLSFKECQKIIQMFESRWGIKVNEKILSTILDAHAKQGNIDEMSKTLDAIVQLGAGDDPVVNTIVLEGLGRAGKFNEAVRLWNRMKQQKMIREATVCVMIDICGHLNQISFANTVFNEFREGVFGLTLHHTNIYTSYMEALLRNQQVREALLVFTDMDRDGVAKDAKLYLNVTSMLTRLGHVEIANEILKKAG